MSNLETLEEKTTAVITNFFKNILFFLNGSQQSLFVSVIHYIIFIVGFYFFFFGSEAGSPFRIFFFFVVAISALSYFIFNRCFFTSVELSLSEDKNAIQKFIDKYFGKEIEGNITSKIVLTIGTLITGLFLLRDYGYLKL